ncbi:MAG: membrane protein insertion efficiency factor YidD [Aquificaceae bacterium]|nr:membrane protein insertion efficiency factor YidD [Aquificaceae bacterium]MDW8433454.1 membrane protein insertion efficiency factor YidD [Aquificaceae bacterium]
MRGLVIAFLKFWRSFISPIYPPSCRYYPSCSSYAIMAVEKHGVLKGMFKTFWRILRCNPLSRGGVDYP